MPSASESPAADPVAAPAQVPAPRPSAAEGTVSIRPTITPAVPAKRRLRIPRPGGGVVVRAALALRPGRLSALAVLIAGGLGLTLATNTAGDQADRVETALAAAVASAQRVSAVAAPVRPDTVRTDLLATITLDQAVQSERGGLAWTTSRWLTRPSRLSRLETRADGLTRLAEAGRPLGAALVAATGGEPDRDRLVSLADSAAGYAAAARESGIVMDDGMRPFAAVAARLPDLAAGPGPRRWTVCSATAGPCELVNVTQGLITSRRTLKGGPPELRIGGTAEESAAGDLVVIGTEAPALVQGTHLSVRVLIDLLLRADPDSTAEDRTIVRTVVALGPS